MQFKTLYGPVRSGRLGLSLGVDLLGKRICSMDCLYCEVGPTRVHTLERRPYMPAEIILEELHAWQEQNLPKPEHITLGGLGEPCLNSDFPKIVNGCNSLFPDIPVAVLTNATLMHDPVVRRELTATQVVLPSLDSLVESEFQALNKPCKGVDLSMITSGLLDFREEFSGRIFLEILLLQNINDTPGNLALQKKFIAKLLPERVDVVTMTRPGASPQARAVHQKTLSQWHSILDPLARGILGSSRVRKQFSPEVVDEDTAMELILNSLRRRPQTPQQLSAALGVDTMLTKTIIQTLLHENLIAQDRDFGDDFYRAVL